MRYGVPQQLALYQKYKDCGVNFLTVYIREAHTKEDWPLGTKFCWLQPKTLEGRLEIARKFRSEMNYTIPMVTDCIENEFNSIFAAWPERYYIFFQGRLAFKAMPEGESYIWNELEDWIQEYLSSTS